MVAGLVVSSGCLQEEVSRLGVRMEVTILGCRLGKWFKLSASVSSSEK